MPRRLGALAACTALTLPLALTTAVPAQAAGYRGQVKLAAYFFCVPLDPAEPVTIFADVQVRYAVGNTWYARQGTTVSIQKKTSTGRWITLDRTNTGWKASDRAKRWGTAFGEFRSLVRRPEQRVFRAYVAGTKRYAELLSPEVEALDGCH